MFLGLVPWNLADSRYQNTGYHISEDHNLYVHCKRISLVAVVPHTDPGVNVKSCHNHWNMSCDIYLDICTMSVIRITAVACENIHMADVPCELHTWQVCHVNYKWHMCHVTYTHNSCAMWVMHMTVMSWVILMTAVPCELGSCAMCIRQMCHVTHMTVVPCELHIWQPCHELHSWHLCHVSYTHDSCVMWVMHDSCAMLVLHTTAVPCLLYIWQLCHMIYTQDTFSDAEILLREYYLCITDNKFHSLPTHVNVSWQVLATNIHSPW